MKILYVKDDEMPKSCAGCMFADLRRTDYKCHAGRINDCPLRPLSEAGGECRLVIKETSDSDPAKDCFWCSKDGGCGAVFIAEKAYKFKFCPNCGARIKRGAK